MSWLAAALVLLASAIQGAGSAGTHAAISLEPTAHDFGQGLIRGGTWVRFELGGVWRGDSVTMRLTGPDSADFALRAFPVGPNPCSPDPWGRSLACDVIASFHPRSTGPKRAVLEVVDQAGNRATAPLTGVGVMPICTNEVVWCNYAHYYSGHFTYSENVQNARSRSSTTVTVWLSRGDAVCIGRQTQFVRGGDPETVTEEINGRGEVGVEFLQGERDSLVYRISIGCPGLQTATSQHRASMTAQGLLTGSEEYVPFEGEADPGTTGLTRIMWSLYTNDRLLFLALLVL